jgi:hydrogenase expression/formation protein HypC
MEMTDRTLWMLLDSRLRGNDGVRCGGWIFRLGDFCQGILQGVTTMCLAMPVQVTELLPGQRARVSVDGVSREVSVALVDNLAVGDFVILHVGYAIGKLDEDEARRTLALIAEAVDKLAEGAT